METNKKKEKNAVLQMLIPAVIFVAFSLTVLLAYSKRLEKIFDSTLDEQMRETAVLYSTRLRHEVTNLAMAADPAADVMASGKLLGGSGGKYPCGQGGFGSNEWERNRLGGKGGSL